MDRVWAETEGDGFAECWLHEQGLSWAADILERWPGRDGQDNQPFDKSHAIAAE